MADQNKLLQARQVIARLSESQRKEFIDKYNTLDDNKKEIAIQRLLGEMSGFPAEQQQQLQQPQKTDQVKEIAQSPAEDKFDPLLPGKQKVSQRISSRQDPVADLLKMAQNPDIAQAAVIGTQRASTGKFPVDLTRGQDILSSIMQRGESALANLGMSVQQNGFNPKEFGQAIKEGGNIGDTSVGKAGMEILKGLAGKKQGRLGDIGVMVGMPEWLADTAGFMAFIGASNLISKGRLVDGVKKSVNASKDIVSGKIAKRQYENSQFLVNKSKQFMGGLDDVHDGLSKNYDDMYTKIGDDFVPPQSTVNVYSKLPQNILNKISKDSNLVRYEDGAIKATKGNLKIIRGIIRKSVPDKVWNGKAIGDVNTATLQDSYFELGDLIAGDNKELLELNSKYRDYINMRKVIYRVITDTDGNPMANGLKNLFTSKGDQGIKNFFTGVKNPTTGQIETVGLANVWEQAGEIVKSIESYNKKQFLINLLERGIGGGAIVQGGRQALRGRGF